jgi:hypothetical protein
MELRDSGALLPVDHVIDTLATRFGDLLALEVVTVDGRTYVVAAGGDDGITLFTLLPDGRLHLLDVMASEADVDWERSRRWKAGGTASRCRSSQPRKAKRGSPPSPYRSPTRA